MSDSEEEKWEFWRDVAIAVLKWGTILNIGFLIVDLIAGYENLWMDVIAVRGLNQAFIIAAFLAIGFMSMDLKQDKEKQDRRHKIKELEERVESLEDEL